jgi:hypothetical protein
MFESLYHLRKLAQEWFEEHNKPHPHQSLNNLSQLGYLEINHQIRITGFAKVREMWYLRFQNDEIKGFIDNCSRFKFFTSEKSKQL